MSSRLCHRRETCRLCGGTDLAVVLELTPTPPANAFVSQAELSAEQERFPLEVVFCRACAHVQLHDVVDPRLLFENYVYVSGTSPVFVDHFAHYADEVIAQFATPADGLVVDIGSNDGTLLRPFQAAGRRVLGVDPAKDIARRATAAGIETLAEFFTPALARSVRGQHGPAAVVTANNVFAHIDNLRDTVEGVRTLLDASGVFVCEVSYLADVFEKTLFDTIYHEHLDYHTVKPLQRFFAANGMELIEARRVAAHGGSLRTVAQLAGGPWPVGASVAEAVHLEERLGLDREETLRGFSRRINALKDELQALLRRLKAEGKKIAGFGAPAKATTLLYHFEIGPELIDFIVDDSPLKQGLYTPGMHIPVLPSEAIGRHAPDYLVVLAWNFAESIMAKHQGFREAGGRFIVPVPNVAVY